MMPDAVEIGAKIEIDDACLALDDGLGDPVNRLMRRPLGSISERAWLKISFEDRLQDELQRSLDHAVADRAFHAAAFTPLEWNASSSSLRHPMLSSPLG